jgi:hypothetical protein
LVKFEELINILQKDLSEVDTISEDNALKILFISFVIHHVVYKSNLYASVTREKALDGVSIDAKSCVLGKWLHNLKVKSIIEKCKNYKIIEELHNKMHELGKKVIERVEKEGVSKENENWYYNELLEVEQNARKLFEEFNKLAKCVIENHEVKQLLMVSEDIL